MKISRMLHSIILASALVACQPSSTEDPLPSQQGDDQGASIKLPGSQPSEVISKESSKGADYKFNYYSELSADEASCTNYNFLLKQSISFLKEGTCPETNKDGSSIITKCPLVFNPALRNRVEIVLYESATDKSGKVFTHNEESAQKVCDDYVEDVTK